MPFTLSCAEWPLMLFVLVPDLVRRLTVRAAVTRTQTNTWFRDKQRSLVRKVVVSSLEGLLRDCTRLIHLQGMEAAAVMLGEDWTVPMSSKQAHTGQRSETLKKALSRQAAERLGDMVKTMAWSSGTCSEGPRSSTNCRPA